jgi:hypothetical protein
MEEGLQWNMNMVKVCHGSFQDGVVEFLMAVDNVMRWVMGDFLGDVAGRLGAMVKGAESTRLGD